MFIEHIYTSINLLIYLSSLYMAIYLCISLSHSISLFSLSLSRLSFPVLAQYTIYTHNNIFIMLTLKISLNKESFQSCTTHDFQASATVMVQTLAPKPKQVLFFFLPQNKSFAGIPRNFCGRVLLFRWTFRVAYSLYFSYDISSFAKQ